MVNITPIKRKDFVYIAIGSNILLGLDVLKSIPQFVVDFIDKNVTDADCVLESVSHYYQTPAYPKGNGPDYINAVFAISCNLTPDAVLNQLHDVEKIYHRERGERWAARTLDLDLLFFGDKIMPNLEIWQEWANLPLQEARTRTPETLILPHPRIAERAFVLGPLCDIAPDLVHPVLQKSVSVLWSELSAEDRDGLERL